MASYFKENIFLMKKCYLFLDIFPRKLNFCHGNHKTFYNIRHQWSKACPERLYYLCARITRFSSLLYQNNAERIEFQESTLWIVIWVKIRRFEWKRVFEKLFSWNRMWNLTHTEKDTHSAIWLKCVLHTSLSGVTSFSFTKPDPHFS